MWNMSFSGARIFAYWPQRGEGATCGPAYNRGRALCAAPRLHSYPPDGLLTLGKSKHDVAVEPLIIAPDPFASDDCLDDLSPEDLFLLTTSVEPDTMNTGEAEPSSGLNGRLRPRKSIIPSPKTSKNSRKPDTKPALDRQKRTSTPSKASPNKPDDLTDKADSPATQTLCPYCDKTYFTKQALSKHVRRIHLSTSKQTNLLHCLFCNHFEADANDIIRHMVDNHPNQYFACYDCHTRFLSTTELAEHKLNVCEKQKLPYRNKLRQKSTSKKNQKNINSNGRSNFGNDVKDFSEEHGFNGIVISCELKSSHAHDLADIEDNITTNFILPPGKNLVNGAVVDKNAVIILDDLQWNKRVPPNFSFQSNDADQILSRLGVVHRSPRTAEPHGREWLKSNDDSHQKFEKCFDTSFYSKVASNVQENLTKFLDGSCNFNPDPENTIKTRKTKNIVAINTVEGFPILLACEQFSRHGFDGYMPRAIAPKHKWKWDNLENDKSLMSPEQIKRDSHTNSCIISLVSSLDIWTQLCMRRKFEVKFNKSPIHKKTEKQNIIGKELKEILESRELPASTSQVVKYTGPPAPGRSTAEFPASLGLVPTAPTFDLKPAVLSGEWVRPRCYVCCACGAQSGDSKGLSSHISAQHPNAQIQHYEIVGEVLLNSDILKHLYVPPSQINNRTRPLRGFRDCTKCKKSISLEDLHQHMLDCAGDTPAVRRKCRYRPFGVRKRRPRLPDNTIRKKMRKDIRTRQSRKSHMRPRPRIRTEVGDAETIRKMLADLPAKRHRVMVKPLNPTVRPRRNLKKTRNKLVMKKRMTEETKTREYSQRENPTQASTIASASGDAEGSKKGSRDSDDRPLGRPFKSTSKRVVSKILRKKDSFNKNTVTKSKRKIVFQKDPNVPSAVETSPSDGGNDNMHVDQLSIENNPSNININNSSYNTREHGSRSNSNSHNRDGQSPDANNGQNNNSGDSFAPSQNVPLKHSIASLTASSETHDKSVQFHHLFLIQQECNNVNQPAGQKMLFENEAVVTKLDKPPLHFNHRRPLDLQAYQKSKLNKPRKGLNDCIAMLKNKLEEPNSSIVPGHVSVQCGDDEPLMPEPIIVERRHSTTELNSGLAQQSDFVHVNIPKKGTEDNLSSSASKSRVTRRSSSTRQGYNSRSNKTPEISSSELMQWRQFYYGGHLLTAQNITENYRKRESSRRRNSLVPTDDLLLQHALNLELLSNNKELTKFAEYSAYPSVSTHYQPSKKNNRRDSQKNKEIINVQSTRSNTKYNVMTRGKNVAELSNNQPNKQAKQRSRSKSVINSTPTKRNSDRNNTKSSQPCNTMASVEKFIDPYSKRVVIEDASASLNIEKRISPVSRSSEERLSQTLPRNTPVADYMSNSAIPTVQYTMHLDAAPSGPLDLSNRVSNKEASVQYIPQEQYPIGAYDTYETLDLSNKNMGTLPVRDTHINSDDVVDLRINYGSHASFQSRYSPLPPELINNEVEEDNATDLSVRRDEDFPTDLSMNRRDYSTAANSYEKTVEGYSRLPINYIPDLSNPIRHGENRCIIVHEYFNENSERIMVVENEVPADFSRRRSVSRTNMCTMEEPIHLNVYPNITEPNDENIPTDLSGKSRPFMASSGASINNTVCNYDNYETQQTPQSIDSDQIIDYHYNQPIQTPSQTSFIRPNNRRSISYCEPSEHFDTTLNTTLPACVRRDLSTNDTLVNQSKTYEQIEYSHSEMPLSLVSNSVIESTSRNPSSNSKSKEVEYDITTMACTMARDRVSEIEPIYTNVPIVSSVNSLSMNKNIETVTEKTDNEICSTKLSETHNPLSSADDTTSKSKNLPISNALASITTSTIETNNTKVEPVKVCTENSDQDPETARKIAMLPKELVEILGTMPVDHRNQLLNVLPQYVSTSTSPVSHSITGDSGSSGSVKTTNQIVEKEFKFEVNSDDGRMNLNSSKNFQFSESLPISVSSSILLTPPTPQLSERYSLPSQESNDIQVYNTRKSRASTEEQTPLANVDSNKLSVGSNMVAVKRLTNAIEYNDPDRVIDLTVDENSSEDKEVSNLGSVIHTNVVTASTKDITTAVISKSNVQKTSNDKTASLRAVRIKTPSERHRTMVSENTLVSSQNKTSLIINVQDDNSKESDNISPMAIQQAEVSSTQHRSVLSTSKAPVDLPTEELQKTHEQHSIEKKDIDKAPVVPYKSSLVTSSLSKNMNTTFDNDCANIVCNDSSIKTPVEAINVSFSKRPSSDFQVKDEIKTIDDVSTKENNPIEKHNKSSFDTFKESSLIDDEDSEDDISLAVIVKQKQRDSNLVSNAHHNTRIDVQSKLLSGNKKKRKPKKINKSEEVTCDKSLLEDKHKFSKNPTTVIVSEISLTNKERICNETNTIDKISYGKKNTRKGRRLNNAQTIKYSDKKDQTNDKHAYENEINKENNVSPDVVKSKESLEESFKVKPPDQDPNRSSSVNAIVTTDINNKDCLKKEKGKKMLEINTECGQSSNEISEINKIDSEEINPIQIDSKCMVSQKSLNSSCIEKRKQAQNSIENEITLSSSDISENEMIQSKRNNLELDALSKTEKSKDEKSMKSKKVSIEFCPDTNVNFELEGPNVTPLRRSRRGKSLFIDSNSTVVVNPILKDNTHEQRAPLTKKQLIFSKLLLDEENHHKTSISTTPMLAEENVHKTKLNTTPQMEEENVHKTKLNITPQMVEENVHKTKLNTAPQMVEENVHKTKLNTTLQMVEENVHKTKLNTTPQMVEEDVHKTKLNTAPQMVEENVHKTKLNITPQMVEENVHKTKLNTTPQMVEEDVHKTKLNTTPQMVEENVHKTKLNITPQMAEENVHKTKLNTIPQMVEENVHKTKLNTAPQMVEENVHKTKLNITPQMVEENVHKTKLNTTPQMVEENVHKTKLNTTPQMVEENFHNTKLNTSPQMVEENVHKTKLNTTPQMVEENVHNTKLNTTPQMVEENVHKTKLNTTPQMVEEVLDKTVLNKNPKLVDEDLSKTLIMSILSEDKNNISPNITQQKPEGQDLETQTKTPSENSVNIAVKESTSSMKIKTNKRKISPQSKRKSKKKKSFGNQIYSEDTAIKLQQKKNTENETNPSKKSLSQDDIDTVSEKPSIEELVKKDESLTEKNVDCLNKPTDSNNIDSSPKTLSIEKRKSCSPQRNDSLQSSKAKKCKFSDANESILAANISKEHKKENTDDFKIAESNCTITSRNITCYNKPARRVRSKSVVVKSSGADFYDPYDIDLEDMVDKTEKKEISAKMSFSSFKSSIAAKTRKLSKTKPAIIDINNDAVVHDNDKLVCHNSDKIDLHQKTLYIKDGSSDSDDSSKSDVPLKKYAEEKEKKLAGISQMLGHNKKCSDITDNSNEKLRERAKARKKNNRSTSINKKEEKIANDKIDSEKDLRSEQFMESFGFFSERKPRKSNLLATKKISETFHIIANDSDDVYFTTKERGSKKAINDNRKEDIKNLKGSSGSSTKKAAKRGRKKKSTSPEQHEPSFCTVCKKAFRRSDNFLRHQMTLYHVSRLCEVELKVKAVIVEEEPNYLIAYKQQLERLKLLQDKIAKRKKNSLPTSDIILPTLEEIVAEVKRTIREQELSRRELSRDEALFLDCCEMLKQSHKKDIPLENKRVRQCNSFNCPQTNEDQLALLEKSILDDKCEMKCDEDMDAITAKNILESDEVRNLENDLISNLKEGNGLKGFASLRIHSSEELAANVSEVPGTTSNYNKDLSFKTIEDSIAAKPKKTEVKGKMYPDILCDNIDMFEDKFDKIKRKCRSQAAAAKQIQTQVDPHLSHKNRKKSDKKKGKKNSKKSQNVVPTKGALKGFDGIKVSILTSDINMSAIVPSVGNSFKKKKNNSKRKRERKSSDVSSKSESDLVTKDIPQKKVDVYEFLDTEDAELFEFRPSTLMERFKSISCKEMPSTSKAHASELIHSSSESASDGDDFVYMDDLLFSEDETENSVLSCEIGCGKGNNETKKSSPLKRKDAIEKNAVMGKIFKHNALRTDKKNIKNFAKPKANLDQLFDSLLEKEPKEQSKDEESPKKDIPSVNTYCSLSPKRKETLQSKRDELPPVILSRKPEPSMSVTPFEELISQRNAHKYESSKEYTQVSKFTTPFSKYRGMADNDTYKPKYHDSSHEEFNDSHIVRDEDYDYTKLKTKDKLHADKSSSAKSNSEDRRPTAFRAESAEEEISADDAGVARQRARRKCTVGKQNVLAETWSSESEPDAAPPRPTSAESVLASHARRKKARKREVRARGPSARTRPPPLCWAGEEPEHPQQHGWIVGDSHKKLVTMLAHAKGRKRSHDDKRPLLE